MCICKCIEKEKKKTIYKTFAVSLVKLKNNFSLIYIFPFFLSLHIVSKMPRVTSTTTTTTTTEKKCVGRHNHRVVNIYIRECDCLRKFRCFIYIHNHRLAITMLMLTKYNIIMYNSIIELIQFNFVLLFVYLKLLLHVT